VARTLNPPSIGDIPPDTPPALRQLLEDLIYAMQLREGRVGAGTNSRFVTIQDLVDAGVVVDGKIK
jgi:hypothetical protein